jgi:hypothetical protein
MSASDYLEAQQGNHLLRNATFAKPSDIWLALFTVKPDDDGTGGTEVSTSSTGYGRVACGPDDDMWAEPAGGNGEFVNLEDFQFGAPVDDWGDLVAFALFDAETDGNLLIPSDLLHEKTVNDGDLAPKFAAGDLKITFS